MELQEWTWNSARAAGELPKEWLNLRRANLCRANLYGANLYGANLCEADLREADLCEADLCEADLRRANLCGANLCGANLDFSCWPLWCGSLNVNVDKKIAVQLAYHFCSLDCDDPEYMNLRKVLIPFANKIHREDVSKIPAQ